MEYELKITSQQSDCYGAANGIKFWMIHLPPKCDGISLRHIQKLFYYGSPNSMDVLYDEITDQIGFGKQWSDASMSKPGVGSSTVFTLCLETNAVDAFQTVQTGLFIEGENGYYAKDGSVAIADMCTLWNSQYGGDSAQDSGYGDDSSQSNSADGYSDSNVWSKSEADNRYECHMRDTNWLLKYKRSYVTRKKWRNTYDGNHGQQQQHRRRRGWWKRRRGKRRRLEYRHEFSPLSQEFYEDVDSDDYDDDYYDEYEELANDADGHVLSSCFEYEIQCSSHNSICFGEASSISSFMLEIPYECGGNEVSLPEVSHSLYWSEPDEFNVEYDSVAQRLGFALSYDEDNKLTLGESRAFTLCFEQNDLNAYKMVLSKWRVQGENHYFSMDGTIYVPDICELRVR